MMNSLQNTVKYLRLINIKTVLKTIKECTPTHINNVTKPKLDFSKAKAISFSPRSIGVEIGQKRDEGKIKQDPLSYTPIVNPRSILPLVDTSWRNEEIGLPSLRRDEVEAARLIVIRKKKMKKHQRRKLWKKMRHRWAKIKQKRRQIKEKIFQNELLALMKQADEFSAEQYVMDKISKANHTPLPTRWRGNRLPEFIIRQIMGIDKKINYKHTDVYKA